MTYERPDRRLNAPPDHPLTSGSRDTKMRVTAIALAPDSPRGQTVRVEERSAGRAGRSWR